MKSTNQGTYNKQQPTESERRPIFQKRLRWFATLIASVAVCAAVAAPVAAAATKQFVGNGTGTPTQR